MTTMHEKGEMSKSYSQMSPQGNPQELLFETRAYLSLFHHECGMLEAYPERLTRLQVEIERAGTYWHTCEELAYGAYEVLVN